MNRSQDRLHHTILLRDPKRFQLQLEIKHKHPISSLPNQRDYTVLHKVPLA